MRLRLPKSEQACHNYRAPDGGRVHELPFTGINRENHKPEPPVNTNGHGEGGYRRFRRCPRLSVFICGSSAFETDFIYDSAEE